MVERTVSGDCSEGLRVRWSEYAPVAVAILLLMPALFVIAHWPFVHDAPIIRYIDFLMANGFAPYRDIIDMQMPGTYLADILVVHTLGSGAFAWFVWDLLNGIVLTMTAMWIAGSKRRLGLIAGILSYLVHLSSGPSSLGQRDWTVAMLMVLGVGCLFYFVRGGKPIFVGYAFLAAGVAATIKPPALVLPVVLLAAIWLNQKRRQNSSRRISGVQLLFWALLGVVLPLDRRRCLPTNMARHARLSRRPEWTHSVLRGVEPATAVGPR